MWKKVDQALEKGLPKTAIEQLDAILASATADQDHDEAIRAVCRKYQIQSQLEGGDQAVSIKLLQSELAQYPVAMQPVLKAILAAWYWNYYQQNRWQFMQRTQTAAPPGEDFTTWDLNRILDEADKLFSAALTDRATLQKTPVQDFEEILNPGNIPDAYRPTLFDFLAREAIQFYRLAEQRSRPQNAFDLSADTAIFGSSEDFLAWKLSADSNSPTVKALLLYQELLAFHANDDSPLARLDADLSRIEFGHSEAYGEEKDARYAASLTHFIDANLAQEISSAAAADLAALLQSQNKLVEAREQALAAIERHPGGLFTNRCRNIVATIEARAASINTERVWNKPWPTIDVTYRNVTKVYFRLVPFDFAEWANSGSWNPENIAYEEREKILKKKPVRQWSHNLPETKDYRERKEALPVPDDLAAGSYYLLASHDEGFTSGDNAISLCEVWVSDLGLVIRDQLDAAIQGILLQAESGKPIAEGEIEIWEQKNTGRRQLFAKAANVRTDTNGFFQWKGKPQHRYFVLAKSGNQSLASSDGFWLYEHGSPYSRSENTFFFTDRAIYRPGQTIQFKGILLQADPTRDEYSVLPKRRVTVALIDHNGQEIEKLELKSNDYGSISGSFAAPRDRGTGTMALRVIDGPNGYGQFNVEEYKRPKFFVTVDPPKSSPRLEDQVDVSGKATAYTSAPIDGATVQYRVVREVRLPPWWYWRCWWWPVSTTSQEIAHGSTITAVDGSFQIQFTATPDRTVPKASRPKFQYTVYADVTDTTGETRSSSTVVNIGYVALEASVTARDWQVSDQPIELDVAATTLDGSPLAADGTVRIYKLQSPAKVHRGKLAERWYYFAGYLDLNAETIPDAPPDWSDINTWPNGDMVDEHEWTSGGDGKAAVQTNLPAGAYRAVVESRDRFGQLVDNELVFQVHDLAATQFPTRLANVLTAPKWSVEPGQEFVALWGTGYETGTALVEIVQRDKILKSYRTDAKTTQQVIRFPVSEALRGGFQLRVTYVRENRAYLSQMRVDVPWSNKDLNLKWERFVSKLQPGAKETWTAVVTGPDAEKAAAEMVAALYDASLDAFAPHNWLQSFGVFRTDYSRFSSRFENQLKSLQYFHFGWQTPYVDEQLTHRHFPPEIVNAAGMIYGRGRGLVDRIAPGVLADGAPMAMAKSAEADFAVAEESLAASGDPSNKAPAAPAPSQPSQPPPDLSKVSARNNLNETAFFFPHLISENGSVRIEFTMPEALTEWKFLGFAHDKELRSGFLTDKVVTAKDLMVQPNAPRFLREQDAIELTVKVSNQSATRQTGNVRLTLADAVTLSSVDAEFANATTDLAFDIPAGQSQSLSWAIKVPDGARTLIYKAVGASERLSDGEEGYLPVISRRALVTESLPLPVRGGQKRDFDFARMREASTSDSLASQSFTVQVTSNPAWYAVMALPYLIEFPYECSEQVFNRLYANALARHIANSDPKIRRVFDQWKGTEALDSPLTKNQDLKSLLIQETPWLLEANEESQARRNVGILFDANRLDSELRTATNKLAQMQNDDGTWPWFPGGRANEFITLYIATGFGRLRHLGVDADVSLALRSLTELDRWIDETYREIQRRGHPENNHLSPTICFYLYGRSFFLKDQAIAAEHQKAVDYFLGQAKKYWPTLGDRLPQGHLAVALNRFGDLTTPKEIVKSLSERSLSDDELGMFWREGEESWWWYRAPIETQALMIEVFDEVAGDAKSVEELQIWLLKQKQTQAWKTTKATADAVYALLRRGTNWLASDQLVEISLAGQKLKPEDVEAGTGYYELRYAASDVKPEFAQINVVNPNPNIAWGSVHWQYFEDMSKVTAYSGTPLKITKSLYVKKTTDQGPTLVPVTEAVGVGEELVTRIELRVDRDMEFVHMKDYRGSGTEPVDVISQYHFQDGLAYYQSTRDMASHFFIDYLPRGTYVFEYSVRVQLRGEYQTGFCQIQCMYAPEFNSHSQSIELKVR
jgi:uncharacterized protein YfaS (alpha-2-macroglobulin family)